MDITAFYKLSYGLFVLTAKDGEKDNGCITNTVMQISQEPLTLAITVNKDNYTNEMIQNTGKFNVSVLSESADFSLFEHFGFASGRDTDKFASFSDAKRAENGVLYITKNTNAYFSCKVLQSVDCYTHTVFIAEVTDTKVLSDENSMTYEYYHKNVKPQPQKTENTAWVCKICGYRYEGEELPADFVCPWCKHPASDFEKV
ncbi:MAG: flavin reductase [Clostridia bacterium]|nr:flavin reductase [Clostridia bacterium]